MTFDPILKCKWIIQHCRNDLGTVVKDVIYLSAIGSFDKYLDWVFHMVTKQTQPEANDAGVVTRCFYERKQLAGNDSGVFLVRCCIPTWWANSHCVPVEVTYLI